MTMTTLRIGPAHRHRWLAGIGCALAWSAAGAALAGETLHVVSQRGREFQPHEIVLSRGDTLEIINDDGDLLHHAYIDSPEFSFDSGDQKPGSKTDVVFTKSGIFTVLCGIHPKMKMRVTVQD